jgi:hypothetical protein
MTAIRTEAERRPRKTKPRHALRVIRGGYAPADASTAAVLREGHRVGDLVFAEFTKPRNPGFHRLAHQLGGMLAENLDAFEGMGWHQVLKRLQIEGDIACEHIALLFPGVGPVEYRQARSLSYESMDEAEFRGVIAAMCKYVARTYWPTCTPEQVESMASCWVEAT